MNSIVRFPATILATLLAIAIPAVMLAEQMDTTGNLNPDPVDCCTCITITIDGVTAGEEPGGIPGGFIQEENGDYKIDVTVEIDPACEDVQIISVKLRSFPGGAEIDLGAQGGPALIPPHMVREFGTDWEVVVICDGEAEAGEPSTGSGKGCIKAFKLSPCGTPCASGTCESSQDTGAPESFNGSFTVVIPTTAARGGLAGALRFHAPEFSYPGLGALYPLVPSAFTVNRVNDLITSVDTTSAVLDIAPISDGFVVTHKDSLGVLFRTTTISFIEDVGGDRFRMDTKFEDTTTRHEQTAPRPNYLVLQKGRVVGEVFQPLWQETLFKDESVPGVRMHRRTIRERASVNHSWQITSNIETTWENQIRGWVQTKEVIDPDRPGHTGAKLTSTWSYYQPGSPAASLGRLKDHFRYDGYQSIHTYSLHQSVVTNPYADDLLGRVTTTTWNPGARTRTIEVTVGENEEILSKTVTTHTNTTRAVAVHTSETGTPLVTTTEYEPSGVDFGGRPIRIEHPDGTLTTYHHSRTAVKGIVTVLKNGATSDDQTVSQGLKTTTTTNSRGTVILRESQPIGFGGADAKIFGRMAVTKVDTLGRAETIAHHCDIESIGDEQVVASNPKWTTTIGYSCCGISTETDRYGNPTTHAYDGLQRRIKTTRLGVTTEIVRDGLTTLTHRYPAGGSAASSNVVALTRRNLAGTSTCSASPDPSSTANGALTASTTETTYGNGLITTVTTVGGTVSHVGGVFTITDGSDLQTTEHFLDGRTASTSGDLAPAMTYGYTVNDIGELTSASYSGGEDPFEITTTQTDRAGRTHRTAKGSIVTNYGYFDTSAARGSRGKLAATTDADSVTTLYEYNARGERTTTAVKLDTEEEITLGIDQVSFSETIPTLRGTTPVWRTTGKVWYMNDALPPQLVETTVSQTDSTPDGLVSWAWQIGQGPAPGHLDATFTITETEIPLDEGFGTGDWTTNVIHPDGSKAVHYHTQGRLAASTSWAIGSIAPATAPADITAVTVVGFISGTSYTYETSLTGIPGRLRTTTDSRTGTTTTAYISTTADFVASVSDSATPARVTKFKYDTRGRRVEVDAPNTLDADGASLVNTTITHYDPDGTVREVIGGQTYRVTYTYDYARRMETMTTYGTETATTTWIYSSDRGLLTRKEYQGGKGTDYTHTPAGRLKTRTWHRGNHTRYDYQAGRLQARRYFTAPEEDNGTNPGDDPLTRDVVFNYDALGRAKTVSEGGNRTWTHTYDPATLRLKTESHPVGGSATQRLLTRTTDEYGRPKTLKAGTVLIPGLDFSVSYDYDAAGRFSEVESDAGMFTYGYQANSYGLIHTVTGQNGTTLPLRTVTNTWEANRDVLSLKENKVAGVLVSSFDYDVNDIGQRTGVTTDGSAFGDTDRGWSWGYDFFGQVTKAAKSDDDVHDRAYTYDDIGNRLTATDDPAGTPDTTIYTPNALNQYEKINAGSEVLPIHDDDGNLREDKGVNLRGIPLEYVWDGENRLIEVRLPNDSLVARYEYDYLSRRTLAITTIDAPQKAKATAYLYDGWNVVAEYEASTPATPVRLTTHTWGLDLSGTMQGAGGVGGLLAVTKHGFTEEDDPTIEHFYPTYDGNGNVSEYLDEDGEEVAHYQYDPFGRLVDPTGDWQDFQYRFSTKPQAEETGFYYYGYRWYDPATGRWPSRDPIWEAGGFNLYGFVGNNGANQIDYLGLVGGTGIGGPVIPGWNAPREQPRVRPSIIEGLKDGHYKCCDDEDLRNEGEEYLNERYRDIEKRMTERNVPRRGVVEAEACYQVNDSVIHQLAFDEKNPPPNSGMPRCWDCHLERRSRSLTSYWIAYFSSDEYQTRDHWVVVCVARSSLGAVVKEISFDYWDASHVPGSNPDDNFRKTFPGFIEYESKQRFHNVCGGPGPPRIVRK